MRTVAIVLALALTTAAVAMALVAVVASSAALAAAAPSLPGADCGGASAPEGDSDCSGATAEVASAPSSASPAAAYPNSAAGQAAGGRGGGSSVAVIFEVEPSDSGRATYFETAAALRSTLETIDGFISVERFESLSRPGKYLSLSFWRDEASVQRWRNTEAHRRAQATGRGGVFRDYRLRVATVIRDYGLLERAEAPTDSRAVHG